MTHDPDRDVRAPDGVNPNVRPLNRERGGMSMGLTIGLIALALVGAFFFFGMRGDNNVASDNRPTMNQPTTTGSGTTAPTSTTGSGAAAPTSPTPPATPAPAKQ